MTLKQTLLLALLSLFPLASLCADYVGGSTCKTCHQAQYNAWKDSPHDQAMQEASNETVLGNFDNAKFTLHGLTTTFFRKDGGFWINTDGPDGKLHDYQVKYTFGVYPLQQYLIPFPGGRLQTLDIAWDSRPKAQGGQRWFHLHPQSPVTADDVLHWTGPNLNWNYMCADCHSTNLEKNYDATTASYHTSWSEIDVSCEACHGPGSNHLVWAHAQQKGENSKLANKGLTVRLDERRNVQWLLDTSTGKPRRSQANSQRKEIDVCAHCHARRSQLRDGFVPGESFMDAYRPALLNEGLYHASGQIRDEVYVWGSFLQSKMYQKGVTCSDCHDPHAAGLKAKGEQACYQCHQPRRYASKSHHHHQPGSSGASCVECHMPAKTYMGVDHRHDHGFRIPQPELSIATDSPNACNQCHTDKSADWALAQTKHWYGTPSQGLQRFAPALDAAYKARPEAGALLLQLANDGSQPAIARATSLSYLGNTINQSVFLTIQQNLQAEDPLLRMGALNALESAPQRLRMLAIPLAWDEIRTIRIQAARLVAGYSIDQLKPAQHQVLDNTLQEYIKVQEFNGERPENQVNLGSLYTDLKQFDKAEAAYRKALQLQPKFVPAWLRLAQLLEARRRQQEAENLLRAGLKQVPESAELQHSLGLFLVRARRVDNALEPLRKAAELAPDNSRYAYVYGVALQTVGKLQQALEVLEQAQQLHTHDNALLSALVSFNADAGNRDTALKWARKLQKLQPNDPKIKKMIRSLEDQL